MSHCRWPQAKEGYNYDETFATAAKIALIHVLLALAAQRDWEIDQIDVVSAYLNADLEDEVYMEVPNSVLAEREYRKVCHLWKGLYGLKQVGRQWYDLMAHTFKALGFNISKLDQSVFFRTKGNKTVHTPVSTNDMIVMGNTRGAMDTVKAKLHRSFKITDQGELMWLLRFEVQRTEWRGCLASIKEHT